MLEQLDIDVVEGLKAKALGLDGVKKGGQVAILGGDTTRMIMVSMCRVAIGGTLYFRSRGGSHGRTRERQVSACGEGARGGDGTLTGAYDS